MWPPAKWDHLGNVTTFCTLLGINLQFVIKNYRNRGLVNPYAAEPFPGNCLYWPNLQYKNRDTQGSKLYILE